MHISTDCHADTYSWIDSVSYEMGNCGGYPPKGNLADREDRISFPPTLYTRTSLAWCLGIRKTLSLTVHLVYFNMKMFIGWPESFEVA
jgi:hypothetical protein